MCVCKHSLNQYVCKTTSSYDCYVNVISVSLPFSGKCKITNGNGERLGSNVREVREHGWKIKSS